jgi:hypothetical protein
LVTGAVVLFFSGIASSAGSDSWSWLKHKFQPPPPEPTEVPSSYLPPGATAEDLTWVLEEQVLDYEHDRYRRVLHHQTRGACYRRKGEQRIFLLWKPGRGAA